MGTPGGQVTGGGGGSGPRQDPDAVKPDLLDFLFTLSLTIGLAPGIVLDGRNGLLAEISSFGVPEPAFAFDLAVFFLGVFTLTFSWYGFNASVSHKPVLYGSIAGMGRFFLDAFLVLVYGFILVNYDNFKLVFASILLIYWLYAVWDGLRFFEYQDDPFRERGRIMGSAGASISAREVRRWRPLGKNLAILAGRIWRQQSLQWALILTVTAAGWYGGTIDSNWLLLILTGIILYGIFLIWDVYTVDIDPNITGRFRKMRAAIAQSDSVPVSAAIVGILWIGMYFGRPNFLWQTEQWGTLLILGTSQPA